MSPIKIQDVVKGKLYIVTYHNDETNMDEPRGIVQAHNDGTGYASGDGLSVQYVNIEVDDEGKIDYKLAGDAIDLFPGTEYMSSENLQLHNIPKIVAGGKPKPRRSQKNKSKSKKGGSRKSKKGGRR
jgi:hypothetical protein